MNKVSLIKPILLFYLLVASNFTKYLHSYQLDHFFKTSRYAQHILGFITMLVVFIETGQVKNTFNAVKYSALAYLWFIFTTKLDLHWNLTVLGLMTAGFLYENWMDDKISASKKDSSLEKKNIKSIKTEHRKIKRLMLLSILFVTIIGTVSYAVKKGGQLGQAFDPDRFVFGISRRFRIN